MQQNFTPEWAKRVVWYQIFPERFRNGDATNDPELKDIVGTYPYDNESLWQNHPWHSDWYEMQPWEKQNFEANPQNTLWKQIRRRRYGGDFQGIIDKLDYLKDLGIGAIYLNPVFDSPSLHKYDGNSYHHIDPNFGPDPEGDRKLIQSETFDKPETWVWTKADLLALKMIEEIHKRGMYVIFDGVFNHVGYNNLAFQDLLKNQKESRFKNWFTVKQWANAEKNKPFKYNCWYKVPELPEWRQNENGIANAPKNYIFAATQRWMQPEVNNVKYQGIDGWRLDVAFLIKHKFWQDWRVLVRNLNPEAYLVAESFAPVKVVKPYLKGNEFDAIMNYQWTYVCCDYFFHQKSITTKQFDSRLKTQRTSYPESAVYAMQNLFDSHDTARIVSRIVNSQVKFSDIQSNLSEADKHPYITTKPNDEALRTLKLMTIFQMTYVGSPMLYYGTEAGMWGANDPCCRKPMVWSDIRFDDEKYLPDGTCRESGEKVEVNEDLFNFYRKLINIRNSNESLQLGDFKTIMADNQKKVFVFSRNYNADSMIIAINNSNETQEIEFEIEKNSTFMDILNGNQIYESKEGKLSLRIENKWGVMLK